MFGNSVVDLGLDNENSRVLSLLFLIRRSFRVFLWIPIQLMCGGVGLFGFSWLSSKRNSKSSHGQLTQT